MAGRGLTGVLLVGGASTRFGSPKALAELEGETLAERGWRILGEACDERLAVGKSADRLPLPFTVLDDGDERRAALVGIAAGLRHARHDSVAFLPVDMPFVTPTLLRALAAALEGDALLAHPAGEPFPAVLRRSALPAVEARLARGDLAIRDLDGELGTRVVEARPAEVVNVNTPTDLRAD